MLFRSDVLFAKENVEIDSNNNELMIVFLKDFGDFGRLVTLLILLKAFFEY